MILSRLSIWVSRKILSHSLEKESNDRLNRFGSPYGGWTICRCAYHFTDEGIYISAGVGEDISFDVEVLRISNLSAILVDPTDRAEAHVNTYLSTPEQLVESSYSDNGNQSISSYFSNEDIKRRMKFVKSALWIHNDGLDLYPPLNTAHVSYKLVRTPDVKYLASKFPSIDIQTIIKQIASERSELSAADLVILKMDIEGSEFSVLMNLTKTSIRPKQILVELDFMRERNPYLQLLRLYSFLKVMKKLNYRLAHIEKLNCLFLGIRASN